MSTPYNKSDIADPTFLDENLSSTETSVTVKSVTNAPSTPFLIGVYAEQAPSDDFEYLQSKSELMKVTGVSGSTFTVERGFGDTSAQTFDSGDLVVLSVRDSGADDRIDPDGRDITPGKVTASGKVLDNNSRVFSPNNTPSASDVGLGNVENKALSNAGWADLGISQGDVSASDVGLGNVENKALSNAGWADLGISQGDISKSNVGLSNVSNDQQVVNAGNTPSIETGTESNRPGAGNAGRLYLTTDTRSLYQDTGSSWDLIVEDPSQISASDLGFDPATQSELDNHTNDTSNPHNVSKSQVGLGNVENKALSNAGWADLGISKSDVSKSNVGLGSVPNLDPESGLSMSDDIDMGSNKVTFTADLALSEDSTGGNLKVGNRSSGYAEVEAQDVRINEDGTWVGDHLSSTSNPHSVTKSQVGLGNVENTALSNAGWADLGISTSDISRSDINLGSAGWADLGISQGDVGASDVGLGNVENKALSNAGWSDLGISQSDVSASNVGLGRVFNSQVNVVTSAPSSSAGQDGDVWFVV